MFLVIFISLYTFETEINNVIKDLLLNYSETYVVNVFISLNVQYLNIK